MGTPNLSASVLERLIRDGWNIVGLICREDKPVGRHGELTRVPTKVVAEKYNIPVFQPHRIRLDYEFVKELKPDLILTLAYGQIIPQGLLDIPEFGCLNIHGSLLPKYRGAAPIQRAIMNGETKTGVTLMEMIDKMDAGRMYAMVEVEILPEDNCSSLILKMADAAYKVVDDNLAAYLEGKLPGEVQNEDKVTFADKIKPEDEILSLELDVESFINRVRALSDEPGGHVALDGKMLKVYKAHKYSDEVKLQIGQISIKKGTFLQLKDGLIELDTLQLEGKKKMDGKAFANGYRSCDGKIVK